MPNVDNWLSDNPSADWLGSVNRAVDIARVIADKPFSITVQRNGSTLPAQTVRIDISRPAGNPGMAVTVDASTLIIFGYRNHPTIADTNLQRGDQFLYDGALYDVTNLEEGVPYRLLAYAQVMG